VVQDIFKKIENDANGKKDPADGVKTASPIKHVIILIGENRGLDHSFGVYKPKGKGQTISKPAVEGHRHRGRFARSELRAGAAVLGRRPQPTFYAGAPAIAKSPYGAANLMPQPNTEGTAAAPSDTSPAVQDDRRGERREGHESG